MTTPRPILKAEKKRKNPSLNAVDVLRFIVSACSEPLEKRRLSLAHSLSAMKRIRQNEKRRLRNRSDRSKLRTQVKKVRRALEEEDFERARGLLPQTASLIDRMVKKGVIHSNTGSRYLSRLARKITPTASN